MIAFSRRLPDLYYAPAVLHADGHSTVLEESRDWNEVQLIVNGELVFQCDINELDFGNNRRVPGPGPSPSGGRPQAEAIFPAGPKLTVAQGASVGIPIGKSSEPHLALPDCPIADTGGLTGRSSRLPARLIFFLGGGGILEGGSGHPHAGAAICPHSIRVSLRSFSRVIEQRLDVSAAPHFPFHPQ